MGTNCVFTQLTAHAGGLCTLVDIVARFAVRHEAVARTTGAYKASRCVGAIVIAVVNGWVCALIDTASFLVAVVRAVITPVTHLAQGDTVTILTFELPRGAGGCWRVAHVLQLIGLIPAVVVAVADKVT